MAVSKVAMMPEVAALMKGKLVVGHAVHNDFKALMLDHPPAMTRDTAKYWPRRSDAASVSAAGIAARSGVALCAAQEGNDPIPGHATTTTGPVVVALMRRAARGV